MSLGQTMISTAFFALLTIAVLTANRMIIERSKGTLQLEAVEGATNLANALLTEILTKKLDGNVTVDGTGNVTGPYTHANLPWPSPPTALSAADALGPTPQAAAYVNPGGADDVAPFKSIAGTGISFFHDVDDYNRYARSASSGSITGYRLTVVVYYVTKTRPDVAAGIQTFYKRIDVTVSNSLYLPKNLVFSAIATY
jgi:hypothetical protein